MARKANEAVTIGAEDDSRLCRSDIIEAVNRVDSGDGVAILTDMSAARLQILRSPA